MNQNSQTRIKVNKENYRMKLPTYEECIKKAMESVEISVNNETGISIL